MPYAAILLSSHPQPTLLFPFYLLSKVCIDTRIMAPSPNGCIRQTGLEPTELFMALPAPNPVSMPDCLLPAAACAQNSKAC